MNASKTVHSFLVSLLSLSIWIGISIEPVLAVTTRGMVGFWKMDGSVQDVSGYNHPGTLHGSSLYLAGQVGESLGLDGRNGYLEIRQPSGRLNCRHAITIETWIKGDNFGSGFRNILGMEGSYALGVFKGSLAARGPRGWWKPPGVQLQTGQWYHVAWTYDGNNHKLYIDGNLRGKTETSGSFALDGKIYISHPLHPFAGSLDEIKVYNRALSAIEIKCSYYEGESLVGYWPFDGNIKDYSGFGHHGVSKEKTIYEGSIVSLGLNVAAPATGEPFHPVIFPDNHSEALSITKEVTLEVWCRANRLGAGNHYIYENSDSYGLRFTGRKVAFCGAGGWWHPKMPLLEPGKWYCITATYNGEWKRIFINGKEVAAEKQSGTLPPGNTIRIGHRTEGFPGTLDELKVYNMALPADVIEQNYKDIPKLVGLWTFDDHARDLSGNGLDGKLINGPRYVKGKVADCLFFDGLNDYVYISYDDHLLDLGLKVSLEAWIYGYGYGEDYRHIYDKYRSLTFSVKGGKLSTAGRAEWWSPDKAALTPKRWYHVVGVYDYAFRLIFIDGEFVSKETVLASNAFGDGVYISHPYFTFYGLIDELKIYNATLSARDVWVRSRPDCN